MLFSADEISGFVSALAMQIAWLFKQPKCEVIETNLALQQHILGKILVGYPPATRAEAVKQIEDAYGYTYKFDCETHKPNLRIVRPEEFAPGAG